MKKFFRVIGVILGILLAAALGYVVYVFASWSRIGDMPIEVEGNAETAELIAGEEQKIVSWNIGFGAYEQDYGFFMDGGHESWAFSKERLTANLENIGNYLAEQEADLYLVQEVDIDSTRSYHVDEREYVTAAFENMDRTFAQNYDSPFLMYPFYQPHGASKAGIVTMSAYDIADAERVELPIENGLTKVVDLDRCYSKQRIAVSNGKELVLYNLHLSAYTSDGLIADEQLKKLITDMQAEYEAGNYCIAGGDFNKDLSGDCEAYFGTDATDYTWAQAIPAELFENTDVSLIFLYDEENPVPSARNADGPYNPDQFVLTIDGFMVTANVAVTGGRVLDTQFMYSDHNPVYMNFILNE